MPQSDATNDAVQHSDAGALDRLGDTDLCEDCEEVLSDYFCNVCQCNLCADCWDRQPAHRRKRLAPGQIPHEKTELLLANRLHTVFSYSGDQRAFERLHEEDEVSAWFGLEREVSDGRPFMFRDHGRFADLASSSYHSLFKERRLASSNADVDTSCYPSLVSFVGQTGAGKSTLIKLLIQINQLAGRDQKFPSPVPGLTGRDLPTSEDVHLYADPLTTGSESPILYADSEGLDGGERDPLAASFRKTRERRETESMRSESDYGSQPIHNYTEREILWMNSKLRRTRQFAATQLYPRILFAFSDVVVFVHRNPRAIEGVLERLLEWGSVAIETTYNQPMLPYAILALNATENDIDPQLWDVDFSTEILFRSLAGVVDKNVEFSKYADFWRRRGRKIDTVEDLMLCYYSAVRLYLEITRGSGLAKSLKTQTRVLLNAFEYQTYLNHAFDHFCTTLETPFDFVHCSYLNSRMSSTLGDSILALAIAMTKTKPRPSASAIFEKLGRLIASSIMLHSVRNKIKGTAERIFSQYIPQIDSVLKEFVDHYWPCEFYVRGPVPPHLQAHLDNMSFQQSMRAAAVIMRCANVRVGHAAKGHQLTDGRTFARGGFQSSFSFEGNRKDILDNVYTCFSDLIDELWQLTDHGLDRVNAAAIIHRDHSLNRSVDLADLRHTSFCICCLSEPYEALLPCGHVLCRSCIKAYGSSHEQNLVEGLKCPLEHSEVLDAEVRSIYLRPQAAGLRVLALNNGGIRSIIQVEVLKLIEEQFQGQLRIQSFFDMIIGEGTGGVIALGLTSRGWSLEECEHRLRSLLERVFAPSNVQKFSSVSLRKTAQARYRVKLLEESLTSLFPLEQHLIDVPSAEDPVHQSTKVAVLTSSATGRKVLFSNYRRQFSSEVPYSSYPVTNYSTEPTVWEIARASMAHTRLFKPFNDARLGHLFFQKDMSENFLIEVAQTECQSMSTTINKEFPDVLLSLGCGKAKRAPAGSIASNDTKYTKASKRSKQLADESKSSYSEDPSESYAQYPRPNFISLNPILDDLPDLDDVSSMHRLQELIQRATDPEVISKIAAQLFATLFYAETDESIKDTDAGEILIPVRVYCRLPNNTEEIREIGKHFKTGIFRNSEFVFWEEGHGAQQFPFPARSLDRMVRESEFTMLRLLVPLWRPDSIVHGVLRLENGQEYSLSGFPRSLSPVTHIHKSIPPEPTPKAPSWSAPMQIPLRQRPGLSDQPGPVITDEESGEFSDDDDDDGASEVTALPKYTR